MKVGQKRPQVCLSSLGSPCLKKFPFHFYSFPFPTTIYHYQTHTQYVGRSTWMRGCVPPKACASPSHTHQYKQGPRAYKREPNIFTKNPNSIVFWERETGGCYGIGDESAINIEKNEAKGKLKKNWKNENQWLSWFFSNFLKITEIYEIRTIFDF